MRKALKLLGGLLVILIIVVICLVLFWLGPVVKKTVETVGPQALGTEVTVEKVLIKPLRGTVQIKGLYVGNPEGFANPSAVELQEFRVIVNLASLLTDTVVVKEILIDSPQFTYERKLKTDNIKELQKNIEAFTGPPSKEAPVEPAEEEAPEKPKEKKPGKKVIIERLAVLNGKVLAKISGLPTAPIPLPDIEKTDLGKEEGGTSYADAAKEIIASIYEAIIGAVANIGDVGEMATDAIKGAGDALKGTGDTLKGAGDSAKDAGEAVMDTAKDALKGIGGLFKKDE
jgi:hypothetical protein